jgi:hypothetical protein
MNICHVEELILGKRQFTVHDIASNSRISVLEMLKQLLMNAYYSRKHVPSGYKVVNIQPEGAACCFVCLTSTAV